MIVNQFPSDAFKRGIYALLPSAAIYLFFMNVFSFYPIFESIISDVSDRETQIVMIKKTLHRVKRKVVFMYIVNALIMLTCSVYLTMFNIVFEYSARSRVIGVVISIGIIFLYNCMLTMIIGILRYCGLSRENKRVYHTAIFLQKYL